MNTYTEILLYVEYTVIGKAHIYILYICVQVKSEQTVEYKYYLNTNIYAQIIYICVCIDTIFINFTNYSLIFFFHFRLKMQ